MGGNAIKSFLVFVSVTDVELARWVGGSMSRFVSLLLLRTLSCGSLRPCRRFRLHRRSGRPSWEHIELGDEVEDFLDVKGKWLKLRIDHCVFFFVALSLGDVLKVHDTLLNEFGDVGDLGKNLGVGATFSEADKIVIDGVD